MDKDLDKLFEETKESGIKAIKSLDTTIAASLTSMALQISVIIGMLCLIFLDMAPVLRIIWMVVVFGYIVFLTIASIIRIVNAFKEKHFVKTTTQSMEIIHDIMSGADSKDA